MMHTGTFLMIKCLFVFMLFLKGFKSVFIVAAATVEKTTGSFSFCPQTHK